MAKIRKDGKGCVLYKGEYYSRSKKLYRYSYMDALKTRRCIYAKDLFELREKKKRLQLNLLEGIDEYAFGRSDLNFAFDRYIATKFNLRSSTKANYLYTYNHYVRESLGKKRISEICFSDVVLFYSALVKGGLSIHTVASVHSILYSTFKLAVRDNIIRKNPADGAIAELKSYWKGREKTRHALTADEEQAFLNNLDRPENIKWKTLFTVMFGTGCRIGEIVGLRWEDIDFENGLISINHAITYHTRPDKENKCEYEVSLPKTKAGIRKIPLLTKVREALEEEYKKQSEYGQICTLSIDGMSNFIFTNRFGGILNPRGINKVIHRIVSDYNALEEVKAAKERRQPVFVPQFSCHITRHTFCSRLCENETNIKVIQSVMGHKDIQTTLDIYAEISEQKTQEVFTQLNDKDILF